MLPAQALHIREVLLTTSCTHRLEMTPLLLGIQPGDHVVVSLFSDDLSLHLGLRLDNGPTATESADR